MAYTSEYILLQLTNERKFSIRERQISFVTQM